MVCKSNYVRLIKKKVNSMENNLFTRKKTLLIVDDEEINRDILAFNLGNHFNIVEAGDGKEALDILLNDKHKIDLVITDVNMPFSGLEVLKVRQNNPKLKAIPFVMATTELHTEEECFKLGVNDFLRKPFPTGREMDFFIARINRLMELYEDRSILKEVEREKLTNLYNNEFFIKYSEEFDELYPDMAKDMLTITINRFRLINELYGREFGDEVLLTITRFLNNYTSNNYGLAGRNAGSTFVMYCEHRDNYNDFAEQLIDGLHHMTNGLGISVRIGVYPNVSSNLDKEIVIGRTKNAADTLRKDYSKTIAIYNEAAQAITLHMEELVDAFPQALEEEQFQLFFQPKYNVQGDKPVFASAEVLIRWISPKFGFVSPGDFIHLFEEHGLISKLDSYILKKAAELMSLWKKKYGIDIPLSINLSRVDIYRPNLVEDIIEYVDSNNVPHECFYIEITESAFVEDAKEVLPFIGRIRSNGFMVEIDDFGSGYSSFGALADLPFDVLKIDMQFIRSMNKNPKVKDIIKMIISLAKMMDSITVAEGVETEDQYLFLKEHGCDVIQGYYFSKPLSLGDFEELIKKDLVK